MPSCWSCCVCPRPRGTSQSPSSVWALVVVPDRWSGDKPNVDFRRPPRKSMQKHRHCELDLGNFSSSIPPVFELLIQYAHFTSPCLPTSNSRVLYKLHNFDLSSGIRVWDTVDCQIIVAVLYFTLEIKSEVKKPKVSEKIFKTELKLRLPWYHQEYSYLQWN